MTSFGKINELPRRWQLWLAGAVVLLLVLLLFPFKSTIVPRWRVHLVDEAGSKIAGINVTEHWQHYLIQSAGSEDARRTDELGVVDFPERTVRASLVIRFVDVVINLTTQGSKAKFGPYGSLVVWGSREYDTVVVIYNPSAALQTEIVVPHR